MVGDFTNNFDLVDLFEKRLAEYTGFRFACAVDCCTNALLLSLVAQQRIVTDAGFEPPKLALTVPKRAYLSVPMMLCNNGFNFRFVDNHWSEFYELGKTRIFDSAVCFYNGMAERFKCQPSKFTGCDPTMVCVSFQQKKRLSLCRGGAILFNYSGYRDILKRLRHDGRNSRICDIDQVEHYPHSIMMGYHCYMEPEKAAIGITKLNQLDVTTRYEKKNYLGYPDISKLKIWRGHGRK